MGRLALCRKEKIENISSGSHIDAVCLESRAKLELILQPYLTETAFNTIGQAKLETLGVGRPRLYDQEAISCTEITPTKFETITISRKQQNRYSKYLIFLKKITSKLTKRFKALMVSTGQKRIPYSGAPSAMTSYNAATPNMA